MKRMTERGEDGNAYYPQCFKEPCEVMGCKLKQCKFSEAACDRLAAYEDSRLSPEDAANLHAILRLGDGMTLMRLRELAVANQEGRVVVLPCKVGDTVWFKTYKNNARDCIGVQPHEVTRISASIIVPGEIVDISIPVEQIGVRVFLSEAEAVAADAKPPAGNAILEV